MALVDDLSLGGGDGQLDPLRLGGGQGKAPWLDWRVKGNLLSALVGPDGQLPECVVLRVVLEAPLLNLVEVLVHGDNPSTWVSLDYEI